MLSQLLRRGAPFVLMIMTGTGLAGVAQADTTLTYAGQSGQYVVSISPKAVRIDGDGAEWQLYRQDDPAILSVEPGEQTFTRLDQDTAGRIRNQMNDLRARINQRLSQLPEGKRVAARMAMAEKIPGLNAGGKIGLDKTGADDRVANVPCVVYQIIRDGQPADTMCVASADALGISKDGFGTVRSMFSLLQNMLKGTGLEGIGLPYQSLSGMPVRFVDGISGEQRALVSVSHQDIPNSRFQVPQSYVEQQPQAPRAGG
ncbi:hypothetical protein [Salinisphaera sp. Q1T1-3]|uniref:hypothetical protein n=1 Tax=Salinisphaera sp. Q1T1-3 TaxID=2321229 RepID=UPI000E71AB54|nr:hypothetical protein [Salinisphaera sp. Q1T1-3]RJS92882.1 hypothetical protein D3260_10015 [Salinisphaera sp. Q1T1-3]